MLKDEIEPKTGHILLKIGVVVKIEEQTTCLSDPCAECDWLIFLPDSLSDPCPECDFHRNSAVRPLR